MKFPGLDAEYSRAAADLLLNCLSELADVLDSIKVLPGIFYFEIQVFLHMDFWNICLPYLCCFP